MGGINDQKCVYFGCSCLITKTRLYSLSTLNTFIPHHTTPNNTQFNMAETKDSHSPHHASAVLLPPHLSVEKAIKSEPPDDFVNEHKNESGDEKDHRQIKEEDDSSRRRPRDRKRMHFTPFLHVPLCGSLCIQTLYNIPSPLHSYIL